MIYRISVTLKCMIVVIYVRATESKVKLESILEVGKIMWGFVSATLCTRLVRGRLN